MATDIPAHRSALDAERALLVEPRAEPLADAIADLIACPERASHLAGGARAYAAQELAWPRFVEFIDEVISEARAEGPRGR